MCSSDLKASASSCFARFSYYGGYVGVAEMNEKQYERLEVKAEKRGMDEKSVGMISLQDHLSWRVYIDGATGI